MFGPLDEGLERGSCTLRGSGELFGGVCVLSSVFAMNADRSFALTVESRVELREAMSSHMADVLWNEALCV